MVTFCSDRVDIPDDKVIANIQDLKNRYAGTTHAQRCFVNLKTRELFKKWIGAKSNASEKKRKVLDALELHKPDRTSVYNYINYLPDRLNEGAVKKFLTEMSE